MIKYVPCSYLYAPNKDRNSVQFYRKLYAVLQSENPDSEESILGRDFNCPLTLKPKATLGVKLHLLYYAVRFLVDG